MEQDQLYYRLEGGELKPVTAPPELRRCYYAVVSFVYEVKGDQLVSVGRQAEVFKQYDGAVIPQKTFKAKRLEELFQKLEKYAKQKVQGATKWRRKDLDHGV